MSNLNKRHYLALLQFLKNDLPANWRPIYVSFTYPELIGKSRNLKLNQLKNMSHGRSLKQFESELPSIKKFIKHSYDDKIFHGFQKIEKQTL